MPGTAASGGRNRKSAKQHRLEGTYQKIRHAGVITPEAPSGVPVPPKPLDGDAVAEWGRMIQRLTALGTLSAVDDAALYQYCQLFADTEGIAMSRAETVATIAMVQENLHDISREDLTVCIHELTELRQLEARYTAQTRQGRMALRQYLVEFGLTPASRTRVQVPAKPIEADPFAKFDRVQIQ